MSCPTIKKAFEDALAKNSLNNADKVLIYDNGTIYSVTYGDFATQMGVTGSLTAINDGGATPILTGTAPNYNVRGLVGGNGVTVQQNASGSITASLSVANAGNISAGSGILVNAAAETVKFKRIKSGAGISITSDANSITIDNTQAAEASSTVVVSTISDLPTASGGVITLADNTMYLFVGDVSTSNRFVIGSSTVIAASDPYAVTLTYTGTGYMFTSVDGRAGIKEIGLSCANGTLFDTTGSVSGNLLVRWVIIYEVKNLGNLNKPFIGFYDWLVLLHTGTGFTYGAVSAVRLATSRATFVSQTDATMTLFDFGSASFSALSIDNYGLLGTVSGQAFLTGLAGSANINAGVIAFVSRCQISGGMDGLDTITADDSGWDFTDVSNIPDSLPIAQLYLSAPATTTIASIGVPVAVNGTFTADKESHFTASSAGLVTYVGVRDKYADITASVDFAPDVGNNRNLFVEIRLNGSVIAATKSTLTASNGIVGSLSVVWGLSLTNGDEIDFVIGNDTSTDNIEVDSFVIRVK